MTLEEIWRKPIAIALLALSPMANAVEHLEWHWEGGGGGSCGPFCTSVTAGHIVIDGWHDDGLSPTPDSSRFPSFGGGKSRDNIGGKIPGADGHPGCTVPRNESHVRAFAPSSNSWKIYVEAGVPTEIQDGLKRNIDAINADQRMRGRDFVVEMTSSSLLAGTRVVSPSLTSPLTEGAAVTVNYDMSLRGGVLFGSTAIVLSRFYSYDEASSLTAKTLGIAAGLAVNDVPDPLYPSAMDNWTTMDVLDPCARAAIDAILNAGRNK